MKKIIVLFSIFFLGTFYSCQDDENILKEDNNLVSRAVNENDKPDVQTQIKLGAKLTNPYSVHNMQNAFNYYNSVVPNSPFIGKVVTATHYYIRILPTNLNHLRELDLLDKSNTANVPVLQDYPLDYEITQEGDYYVMPSSDTDLYHPIYALIPKGYTFKAGIPYTILEDIYEPTEQEYDVETASLFFSNWIEDLAADDIVLTTSTLPTYLIEQSLLQNRGLGKRYTPAGGIRVQNTDSNVYDPLLRAKISVGRGVWWHYTYTDNNGNFTAPKKYRGKVRIRAKWRGDTATVRKAWNELIGIQVSDHLMTITRGNNNITKNIEYSWGEDAGHLWYKGTVHNGIRKYVDYCNSNGISYTISDANVWVSARGTNTGATPMLYKYPFLANMATITGIGESNLWDVLANELTSQVIGLIPLHLRPDQIYKGLRNGIASGNTVNIHQLVFHESGHYSHASKAGATFWSNVFASELSNSITGGNMAHDPYRDGSMPSFQSGRRIALAEGWATLTEYKITTSYYNKARITVSQNTNNSLPLVSTNLFSDDNQVSNITDALESFTVYDTPMSVTRTDRQSWFLHGIMWDILDSTDERLLNNNVALSARRSGSGVLLTSVINDKLFLGNNPNNLAPLFNMLTSNVQSASDLKSAMLSANPSFTVPINNLFNSYGY